MNYSDLRCPSYLIRTALRLNCRKFSRLRRMRINFVFFIQSSFCDCRLFIRLAFVVGSGVVTSSGFLT